VFLALESGATLPLPRGRVRPGVVNSQAAGSCGKRKLVRIPWKAFISRVLNLSYLIGEGESIPNISTSKKAIWRGFLTYPEFFPPPPQTVGHGVGCVCVCVCVCRSSIIQGQGRGVYQAWKADQWAARPWQSCPAQSSLTQCGQSPPPGQSNPMWNKVSWEARHTRNF
jgi:hypothetical protein